MNPPGKRDYFPFAGFAFLNLCSLCVKNCFALICPSLMTLLIDWQFSFNKFFFHKVGY